MGLRVAITGGIACGKSLFSTFLQRLGVEVLDADDVVHRLEGPGGRAVPLIRELFGDGVLLPDGSVDRRVLGERVFSDSAERERLNRVLHPLVREELLRWASRPGDGLRAVVIPLLFESGWEGDWDRVVCLVSGEREQLERLMRGRGLTECQARARMAAQMPVADKAARSHLVVDNRTDADQLRQEAERVCRFLREISA